MTGRIADGTRAVKTEPHETAVSTTFSLSMTGEHDEKPQQQVRASRRENGNTGTRNDTSLQQRVSPIGASPAAAAASDNNTTSTNDIPDVEIERENSAWDALGERFEDAASNGRYIDLTTETHGKMLDASRAQADFSVKQAPIDPSTIVQQQQYLPTNEDPALAPLWEYVSDTLDSLRSARESLCSAANRGKHADSMRLALAGINRNMRRIQRFVNAHSDIVADSCIATKRIEELNLLVHKANVFIEKINQKGNGNNDSRSKRRRRRR